MILINTNLSFVMLKQYNDMGEQLICIEALINGRTISCNKYVPNKVVSDFSHDVNRMLGHMEGQVIMAGDFNQEMDA